MERNQLIGFALIFVLLMVWTILNKPSELQEAEARSRDSISQASQAIVEQEIEPVAPIELDSIQKIQKFGSFSSLSQGDEEEISLENKLIKIVFTNKGGRPKYAELVDYDKIIIKPDHKKSKEKVRLFEDEKNRFNFEIPTGAATIFSEDLYFTPQKRGDQVIFSATSEDGRSIELNYTLNPSSYLIDMIVKIDGFRTASGQTASLSITNYLDQLEKNVKFEKNFSTVYFKEKDEDSDYCSCTSSDSENLDNKPVQWVSFANQFFNTSIISKDKPFEGLVATTDMQEGNQSDLKKTSALLSLGSLSGDDSYSWQLYMGPNDYKTLKAIGNELEEVVPFGRSIFGDINRHFIRPFFDWLSQFVGSKGLVIILLIFIIKMALYPLTYKMLHSQAKMGALKPQLADMKNKFKDDMQKQQMETMKVYREYGVSPFGGCMPMVVQMPIWYALFRFFPASITFRQESFLWAADLSSYDEFLQLPFSIPSFGAHLSLFTVLWAVTTVIYTYYNMKHMDMSANPAMKYVQYLMPVMFFVFFNSYASGLTCYMFFSNLFNIAQTVITKQFVFNDERILAELNKQKEKPKKKGGFQARIEEAMKQSQLAQEQRNKAKKK